MVAALNRKHLLWGLCMGGWEGGESNGNVIFPCSGDALGDRVLQILPLSW